MNLVAWFLKTNEERMRGSALAYERSRASVALVSRQQAYRSALEALASAEALPLGVTDRGDPLRVGLETIDRHSVIAGATGSGKTRAILDRLLRRCVLGLWRRFEFELFDPKSETFTELKKHLAAWWLVSDEHVREEIARSAHVIDWTRDRITPTAPYDNSDGVMTDAYAAELHTRVTIEASDVSYTDSLRQLLFMWSYLLIDLRYPPNFNFALRFFRDGAFRNHVLSRVKSADVRQYFLVLGQITAQQTHRRRAACERVGTQARVRAPDAVIASPALLLSRKGHSALRCRTSDVPSPSAARHIEAKEELLDIFDRYLAPTSMIPVHLAARLIEEWEAEVLGQQQVRENAPAPRPRSDGVAGGLDQCWSNESPNKVRRCARRRRSR